MSTITLVMYSSTSTITLLRTRVRVLKKYSYEYTSTITPSLNFTSLFTVLPDIVENCQLSGCEKALQDNFCHCKIIKNVHYEKQFLAFMYDQGIDIQNCLDWCRNGIFFDSI